MLKNKLTLSLLSVAILSTSAFAATNSAGGIISFSGAISDTTCTINGGNSADFSILLDPITVTDAGTTASTVIAKNQKEFALTFSDCAPASTPSGSNLKIHFSSANTISTSGLYLVNDTANENDPLVAKNVGFSLSTPAAPTVAIPLNATFDTGIKGDKTAPDSDTLRLIASYYKTNATAAKTGPVHSNVIYTVSYL